MTTAERVFERVATSVVVGNAGVVVWSMVDHVHEELTERLETGFLLFFVAELVVRLSRRRGAFLRDPWEMFDFTVIGLSLLPMFGVDVTLLRVARLGRLARLAHLARHLSGLRVLRLLVGGGRLVPVAAALTAALLVVPVAHADPDDTTAPVCTGFDLGVSPAEIAEGLQRNGTDRNYWQAQRDSAWPIIGGQCDN